MNQMATPAQEQPLQARSETGTWRGESVQVASSQCDVLTDAAEEITFAHSERTESHKLEERKFEARSSLLLPRIETIQKYFESLSKGDQQQKLKEFVANLKQKFARGGQQEISPREESRQAFGNTTEQFLALSFAAEELSREGGDARLLDLIREDLENVFDDFGGHIRADLNSIGVAAEFGHGDAEQVASFQAAYRDAVLDAGTLSGTLKTVLDRFGSKDFNTAVDHLIRALGDDLACMENASVEPTRLNAVLQDLYLLEVLETVLDACQELSARLATDHHVPPPNAADLLQDLVSVCAERWLAAGRFASIADKHGASELAPRIAFLTALKVMVRDMPVKVFPDADARFNVQGAVQDALDEAIGQEDE